LGGGGGGTTSWTPDTDIRVTGVYGYGQAVNVGVDPTQSFTAADGPHFGWIFGRYQIAAGSFQYESLNFEVRAGDPLYVWSTQLCVVGVYYEPVIPEV
jgi:hypothetical protein